MSMFDLASSGPGIFNPQNGNFAALAAIAQSLANNARPSRLPVPGGAVVGDAAAAAFRGALAGQQAQQQGQQLTAGNLAIGRQLDQLRMLASAMGLPAPNLADIQSGKFAGLMGSMPNPGATDTTGLPASGGTISATPLAPPSSGSSSAANGETPDYQQMALSAATQHGIDPTFYHQLIATESAFNPTAVDPKAVNGEHATGIAQFMPSTAAERGVDPLDPTQSLYGGASYFADLLKQSGGDYIKAAQGYGTLPTTLKNLDSGQRAVLAAARAANMGATTQAAGGSAPAIMAPLTGAPASGDQAGTQGEAASPPQVGSTAPGGPTASAPLPNGGQGISAPLSAILGQARTGPLPITSPGGMPTTAAGTPIPAGASPLANGASPRLGAAAVGSPAMQATNANGLRMALTSALMKQYLGYPLTPVDSAMMSASMAPPGSPSQRLNQALAAKLAGMTPFIGGERPGVPGRAFSGFDASGNPQYSIAFQNPRTDTGQVIGPGGQIGYAPGYLPAMQSAISARAGAENRAKFGDLYTSPGSAPAAPALPSSANAAPVNMQTAATNLMARLTRPVATDRGTVIPPLNQQGPLGAPAQLEAALPDWQKTVSTWTTAVAPAQQAEQRLWTIAHAFQMINSGKFQEVRGDLAGVMRVLGLPDTFTNPDQVETALHENYLQTLQRLKASTSRFTQQEFRITSENSEHPDLQPAANLQMLSEDIAALRRSQNLPRDWAAAQQLGWRNPQAFQAAWAAANPLGKAVQNVRDLIGPLKGMPGYQPPVGPQLGQGQQPAMPQIAFDPKTHREIIARDGQWYWRDTGQPLQPSAPIAH